jgi:hypothetical protein
MTPQDLISVFTAHSTTLKSIVLKHIVLNQRLSPWDTVLHHLIDGDYPSLQYVGVYALVGFDMVLRKRIKVWVPREELDSRVMDEITFELEFRDQIHVSFLG